MENYRQYEVDLKWDTESKGKLSCPLLSENIDVAICQDLSKGMPNLWSPEHLFVAAVESCFMLTFLAMATKSNLRIIAYKSKGFGTVDKPDSEFQVIDILLKPTVIITVSSDMNSVLKMLERSAKRSPIANSIKTRLHLSPCLIVGSNE